MSRTYKDKPNKFRKDHYRWHEDWERITYTYTYRNIEKEGIPVTFTSSYWEQKPTSRRKKRREVDTEDHWMSTPGWWTRLLMNKPQRRAQHLIEKAVLKAADIEDVDFPDLGRKPHVYYW